MPDVWRLIGWLRDALEELKPVGTPAPARAREANGGNGGNGAGTPSEVAPGQPESGPDE
jgi:hypothetical protein